MAKKHDEYDFTLVVEHVDALTGEIEDALFVAGCDDATISMQHGLLCMDFTRSAASLEEAILSAIRDVEKAGIGARVLRVDECGLVSQAEMARRIGRTRQLVGQYISGVRGPGGFPAPEYRLAEKAPLWSWREVSVWLAKNGVLDAEKTHQAAVIATVNRLLENDRQEKLMPGLVKEISKGLRRVRVGRAKVGTG